MVVSAPVKPLTFADLEQITDRRHRYEILQGELIVSAAPTPVHVEIATLLTELISAHVRRNRLGRFYGSSVNVQITRHDVVEPDLCFVSMERSGIIREKLIEGAPDLVIEVLSPSTQSYDRRRKMALYAGGGVREYWIVDPVARSIRVLRFDNGVASDATYDSGTLSSDLLPGFALDVGEVFPAPN